MFGQTDHESWGYEPFTAAEAQAAMRRRESMRFEEPARNSSFLGSADAFTVLSCDAACVVPALRHDGAVQHLRPCERMQSCHLFPVVPTWCTCLSAQVCLLLMLGRGLQSTPRRGTASGGLGRWGSWGPKAMQDAGLPNMQARHRVRDWTKSEMAGRRAWETGRVGEQGRGSGRQCECACVGEWL